MVQIQSVGVEGRPGDQVRVLFPVQPVPCQGAADGGHVHPELMGPPCLRPQPQEGQAAFRSKYLIVGDGPGTVRPDAPAHHRIRVPADGGVDSAGFRIRTADAHRPVLPAKPLRVERVPEPVVDVAALGYHHQSGGALVQPVHRVEHEVRAPLPGQGSGHGGRVRQEIGGVGRHTGRLVHHQQMAILPDDGQGPGPRRGAHPGRTVVAGLHLQHVAGVKDIHCTGMDAVDPDAVLRPGQPGYGVGGDMERSLQDMPDRGAVLFRRQGI